VVDPEQLRAELARRLAAARGKEREFSRRRHGVPPV
jgi:acetyl-CoA carboxylase carboxyltransferase component